jgi:hypothetical protein
LVRSTSLEEGFRSRRIPLEEVTLFILIYQVKI